MASSIQQDAHAVLLPAFAGTGLSDATRRFLDEGGVSILIGESREEYVARRVTGARRAEETAETFIGLTDAARRRSGMLLAAVDQELGGICRLHDLVPPFPTGESLRGAAAPLIRDIATQVARRAAEMGINVFLAPILDVLTGSNPWLEGRTWSGDIGRVACLSAAFIEGVQAGGVAATGKHFPGFSVVTGDPAIDAAAVCPADSATLSAGLETFRAAVDAGVAMMMVGPAIVTTLDDRAAALRSRKIVAMLKDDLQFKGIVMSDDLDAAATLRGDTVATTAIGALKAGCDLLMLADIGRQLEDVVAAIVACVDANEISAAALAASAAKVRALAVRYETRPG